MTLVVVAAGLLIGQLILASVVHALVRRHGRERDRLINQICHLSGKPWQPAPAESQPEVEVPPGPPRLLVTPEQEADDLYT